MCAFLYLDVARFVSHHFLIPPNVDFLVATSLKGDSFASLLRRSAAILNSDPPKIAYAFFLFYLTFLLLFSFPSGFQNIMMRMCLSKGLLNSVWVLCGPFY